jgi:hypothetical protein
MSSETSTNTLHPWQFFALAALGCATAVTFLVRDRGIVAVVLISLLMGTCALIGLAVVRVVLPLVAPNIERTVVVGRTRAALEEEKNLALRTIKELEFDRAMGKVSEQDFREMSVRLRGKASRLIRQLEAGDGYRGQIEKDLAKRLGDSAKPIASATCAKCSTENDPDARFCKECGAKL